MIVQYFLENDITMVDLHLFTMLGNNPSQPLAAMHSPKAALATMGLIAAGLAVGVLFMFFPVMMTALSLGLFSSAIAVLVGLYCQANTVDAYKTEGKYTLKSFLQNIAVGAVTGLTLGAAMGALLGGFLLSGTGILIALGIGAGAGMAVGGLSAAVGEKLGRIEVESSLKAGQEQKEPSFIGCNAVIPGFKSQTEKTEQTSISKAPDEPDMKTTSSNDSPDNFFEQTDDAADYSGSLRP